MEKLKSFCGVSVMFTDIFWMTNKDMDISFQSFIENATSCDVKKSNIFMKNLGLNIVMYISQRLRIQYQQSNYKLLLFDNIY
jgi:hypothetical protein